MIEMQMAQHHVCDVARFHPQGGQSVQQPSIFVSENLALDVLELLAASGVDETRFSTPDYLWTSQFEPDAVLFVGRMLFFPKFAGHHAEHAAAVVEPQAIGQKRHCQGANLNLRWSLHHPFFPFRTRLRGVSPLPGRPHAAVPDRAHSPASQTPSSIAPAPAIATNAESAARRPASLARRPEPKRVARSILNCKASAATIPM